MKKVVPAKPLVRRARHRAMIELSVPDTSAGALAGDDEAWIELFPYGLSISGFGSGHASGHAFGRDHESRHRPAHRHGPGSESRPVLILKDAREENTLPVWMHPSALGQGEESQDVTRALLAELKIRPTHCQINEISGHRQYAMIFFDGHPTLKSLRVRADFSMTFCLAFKARFYSTKAFMMRCRDVDAEMMKLEDGLINHPEFDSKSHPYVM